MGISMDNRNKTETTFGGGNIIVNETLIVNCGKTVLKISPQLLLNMTCK
jgi:hypothetical protein